MTTAIERELKFEADGELSIEDLGGDPLDPRTFTSTYHDTDDGLLLRLGILLRRRMENGKNVWQLELPREDSRVELEVAGGAASPPVEIIGILRATLDNRRLRPVATLRTQRRGRLIDGAEVTLDAVEVLEGQRVGARFHEIEAEHVTGNPSRLAELETRLRKAGARTADGHSKLRRVIEPAEPEQPGRRAPALAHLRAMIGAQLEQLLRHDPGVRVGGDPEDVHAMRVAIRRSRAVLRVTKPMLDPDWVDDLRAELEWLGDQLAPVRDLHVLSDYFEQELASLPSEQTFSGRQLLELLTEDHERAREALLEVLDTDRYLQLLAALEAAAKAPRVREADVSVEQLASKEFRKLCKRRRQLSCPPSAAELHKLRIHGKRARYAAELAATTTGGAAKRFIKRAKALQDVLGEHQDAVVAEDAITDLAIRSGDPQACLAAGRIIERQNERRRQARDGFPEAWKQLRRAGNRAWHGQ
jgi:CHAD domain-containing protein